MIAAGAESRRRLPILTLDEAKLSVSFGYVISGLCPAMLARRSPAPI